MDAQTVLFVLAIGITVFGVLGGWVSDQKHRPYSEGFILGAIFGPLGCLIAVMLPTLVPLTPPAPPTEEELHRLRTLQAALEERRIKEEEERDRRIREADERRRAALVWFLTCGWFRDLPGVVQSIVLGMVFAVPAVVVIAWLANR